MTYGCFNNLAKIDEASIALWSTLLRDRGDRRLLLRTFALDVPRVRDRITARFEAHGVRPDQLILSPASPHRDLLDSYNAVDIALDPLAYSGGLTTLEALWMGVPVITLPGDRFCTRHSLAHLTAAGLTGLVAEDASGYLARAEGLAADLERLAGIAVEAAGAHGRVAAVRCRGFHADAGSGLPPDVAGPLRRFIESARS